MMAHQRPSLFQHLKTEVSPSSNPTLWAHRMRQRRPLFQDPFEAGGSSGSFYAQVGVQSSGTVHEHDSIPAKDQTNDEEIEVRDESHQIQINQDLPWGEQIPTWLNLFYDLAWTATFSSLTNHNEFQDPWDSVSYVVFFTTTWWLWASQVAYNAEFYSDDWFHLLFSFLQLMVFGALAATTKGFDVRSYISISPGETVLEPYNELTATPERHSAEQLTKISLRVIMAVLSISRVLLLIQHLRVIFFAHRRFKTGHFPRRLFIVPLSLAASTALFFAAFGTTTGPWGQERWGAITKYILWATAILVEVFAHATRLNLGTGPNLPLRSHGSITGRLNDITTIIIGEGINQIAATFYAIEQAPGFSKIIGGSVTCCGIIVFFLAYLYFEGASPLKSVRRRAAWMMVHLPWLLSVVLLLQGVKNQLLLSSFIRTADYLSSNIDQTIFGNDANAEFNSTMRMLLLHSGLVFDEEMRKLENLANNMTHNLSGEEYDNALGHAWIIWYNRVRLHGIFASYKNFMRNESIPESTYSKFMQYMTNDTMVLEDNYTPLTKPTHFTQIYEELAYPNVVTARYIMVLCGATFLFLATLNLIQSWPRDRFHWGSIISRYSMGVCLCLLAFLNLGKHQNLVLLGDQKESEQAGVLRWINEYWVLPTLALAYVIQFMVDTVLVYVAVRCGRQETVGEIQYEEDEKTPHP